MSDLRRSIAIAVFVKTPGYSPFKTRLAADIGRAAANRFYKLALAAVEATVAEAAAQCHATAYWAVAEEAALADSWWQRFQGISQGEGELGDRLARVFDELGRQHDAVLALSSDSPQITPQHVHDAASHLTNARNQPTATLGRCHDGGFYLVGVNTPVPADVWRDIPYSTEHTADRLDANLAQHASIVTLPPLADVDRAEDLPLLEKELRAASSSAPQQHALLNWLKQQ